jgi:hypothetical protein
MLEDIVEMGEQARRLDRDLAATIAEAKEAGATSSQVAEALGMTCEDARRRYWPQSTSG